MSIFEVRSSDEEITPANDMFSKADRYHVVPPPITGNFLTLRADISFIGLDEYAIRKKIIESKTTELNTDTSKSKTNETVDDEDDVSAVKTVSPVKTNETQIVRNQVDKFGQISQKDRIGFKKIKACFRSCYTKPTFRPRNLKQDVKTSEVKNMTTAGTRAVVNTGKGNPESILQDHALMDSGCSSHMTGNKAYLSDYKDYNEGFVAFRSDPKEAKLVLPDLKVGAARQKFVLLVTVTTVAEHTRFSLINYNR
ncbi:hypothetical protein Tco_1161263 [Tanacetum coccineum]